MEELKLIESKGDITFYLDSKGNKYQKIGSDTPYKVKESKSTYKHVKTLGMFEVKYNLDGRRGYSIWRGKRMLQDNFWSLDEADSILKTILNIN